VFISSLAALVTLHGSGIYSASKRAMEAITDGLRLELTDFGVSVTSVLPGHVATPIVDKQIDDYRELISEELYNTYKYFFEVLVKKRRLSFVGAPGPNVTSEVIIHALVDPYPQTRYYVGSAGGYPPKSIPILTSLLPDRLLDKIRANRV